jgi:hypothetical protein
MGKKAKAHRAKVQKRNRMLLQERYTMQNSLTKMMKEMALQQNAEKENLQVKVGDETVPFEVVAEPMTTGIKGF